MPWEKGQSGNQRGRPPKGQTLVEALAKEFLSEIEINGEEISPKDLMARFMREAVVQGKVTLPDGDVFLLSPEQWMDCLKWTYTRIDGPPKQTIGHEGDLSFEFNPLMTIGDTGPEIENSASPKSEEEE